MNIDYEKCRGKENGLINFVDFVDYYAQAHYVNKHTQYSVTIL